MRQNSLRCACACCFWSKCALVLADLTCYAFSTGAGLSNKEVIEAVLSGSRLPAIAKCPRTFHDLMTACWSDAPKGRPAIAELHRRVAAVTRGLLRGSRDAGLGFLDVDDNEVSVMCMKTCESG
jgi:hypothetical protein